MTTFGTFWDTHWWHREARTGSKHTLGIHQSFMERKFEAISDHSTMAMNTYCRRAEAKTIRSRIHVAGGILRRSTNQDRGMSR